jgi:transcriptional regulator with XRE-family HTH domain
MTLKEIRESRVLTQGAVSQLTGINIPVISNYEAGHTLPTLEDCIKLEQVFEQPLEWTEIYKPKIAQSIITLMEYYPLTTVINFVARYLRTDYGDSMIQHYANLAEKLNEAPLLPPRL